MNSGTNILEAPAAEEAAQPLDVAVDTHAAAFPNATAPLKPVANVQTRDFRKSPLLSARDLQKLRVHQNDFVNALASRLSLFLRLEFT